MTSLSVARRAAADLSADVLVLGATGAAGDAPAATIVPADALPAEVVTDVEKRLAALKFAAGVVQTVLLPTVAGVKAPVVLVVGLGPAAEHGDTDPVVLRRAAGAALMGLTDTASVALALPVTDGPTAAAVAEGAALGAYRFTAQRGKDAKKTVVTEQVTVVTGTSRDKDVDKEVTAAVARAEVVARQVGYARDLVNASPNLLYPETFAADVTKRAKGTKVKVSVLDDAALLKGGYGGIVGVGQGSVNLPRMVTMTYAPAGATTRLALIGKGMTFDSGGLDIKPADGMAGMKSDMAGAAAVAATVFAIAELGLPVAVTGVLGLAENMPSGSAQRASDVVTMRNGTTVEITNTDAEGRMVLADCMTQAADAKPDAMIDIATLTGHQVIALGNEIAAVMGNDDAFRTQVCDAAGRAGEPVWPMPLPKSLRSELDTPYADLRHKGGRPGGMLTAGIFLQEFVPQVDGAAIPWAHVDIAGPSFNEGGVRGFTPKGGTGFGVALMVAVAEDLAEHGVTRTAPAAR